jgi:hypothetical protein
MVPQYNLIIAIVTYYESCISYIDPLRSKPRNNNQEWREVQDGIKSYYNDTLIIVNRDRFLKNKCDPFRAVNIAARIPYFMHFKIVKKSEMYPPKNSSCLTPSLVVNDEMKTKKK